MKLQKLVTGIAIGLLLSSVSADEADETDAFKAAYLAYQKYAEALDYVRAVPEAKAAYEIGRRLYGKEHKSTAVLAYNYGRVLVDTGDVNEAKKIFREAVSLFELVHGKDSIELIPILMNLGTENATVFSQKDQKKYYGRALKLARNHYGPKSARYGSLLLAVGVKILNESKFSAAKTYLQDAYQVLRNSLGDENSTTGVAAFQLARFEVAKKQYADGEEHLLAALKTFRNPDQPSTEIEMSTHTLLVSVYEELGESEKATAHCQAIGRMTPIDVDQEYLPLYRKEPRYPQAAMERGWDGYVDLEFTVDHEGYVQELKAVNVQGHRSFVDSSITAVKGYRYAPRFVDGHPVSTPGVRTRISYGLANW